MLRTCLILLLTCYPVVAQAQVYKHVDENGKVTFTDQPPPGAELIEIRPPNTTPPPADLGYPKQTSAPEDTPAQTYEVRITAPDDETIIPRGPGNFSVSANISPSLQGKEKLQLLMNGEARGEPQSGSSWSLTNVFRGTQVLEVTVIDAKGKELAKSEPVTVYVFRPSSNF